MITRRRFIVQSVLGATVLSRGGHLNAESGQVADSLRKRLAVDSQRPQYHFLPKANWVNDPNGPIFWKGYYHLFYQYSSTIDPQGPKYWGHARSKEMVYWEHLPMALVPTPGGPDKDGCWSGSAFINDGVPTLVYTGVGPQVQCLATSDDDMTTWKKFSGNPVVGSPPAALMVTGFRDPSIWREGDSWLMTVGSGFQDRGGAVLLYGSKDLERWDYLHPRVLPLPSSGVILHERANTILWKPVTCGNARTFSLWGRNMCCWFRHNGVSITLWVPILIASFRRSHMT